LHREETEVVKLDGGSQEWPTPSSGALDWESTLIEVGVNEGTLPGAAAVRDQVAPKCMPPGWVGREKN